ncbi:hypothetical protein D3C78_1760750 [compost metagenome]
MIADFYAASASRENAEVINPDIITDGYILAVVVGGLVGESWVFPHARKAHLLDLLDAQKTHFRPLSGWR